MDSSHKVPVVRINEILPHPNADKLGLVHIGGYQVVVRLDNFKPGDLAVYIQPDSIVPVRKEFEFVYKVDGGGKEREFLEGEPVPEKYRRVTVRKFRKQFSEGLLLPISDFPELAGLQNEGGDVADTLGITHYNPPEPGEASNETGPSVKQSKVLPRSLKGWLYFLSYWLTFGLYNPYGSVNGYGNESAPDNTPPVYDVETFKNYTDTFADGEEVVVTEKIHGSNARYTFRKTLLGKDKFYCGSRKLWKSAKSKTVWRKAAELNPDIERFCRNNPGYTLYGEVVPTQTGFPYNGTAEEPKVIFFDILSPNREWVNFDDAYEMTSEYTLEWVPLLYRGGFNLSEIQTLVDGKSRLNKNHIREGVVIKSVLDRRVPGLGRAQLKIVSNAYLEKQ